jgi:hypothetical protein
MLFQRVNIPVPVVKIVEVPVERVVVRDQVVEVPVNIDVTTQRSSGIKRERRAIFGVHGEKRFCS